MKSHREMISLFWLLAAATVGMVFAGCDNKETLLDVDAPNGGVEIQRNRDTGSVTVEVDA